MRVSQVIAPTMGWVRNYHAWQMYDHTDGATFGAVESSAIDMMHICMNGYKTLPGEGTKLAEILQVSRHSRCLTHKQHGQAWMLHQRLVRVH